MVSLLGAGADGRTLLGQMGQDTPPANRVYLRSIDGGASWDALPPLPDGLLAGYLTATADGTVYASFDKAFSNTGNEAPPGIYKARPGTSTWTYVASLPAGGWFIGASDEAGHPIGLWASADPLAVLPAIERHQP